MATVTPDMTSVLIVLGFLGVLIAVRQLIVSKSAQIKVKLGTTSRPITLLDSYRVARSTQLSLFEISGHQVLVLSGARGQSTLLRLNTGDSAELPMPEKVSDDA